MPTPYLAPSLISQGYSGASGRTPNSLLSSSELGTLQHQYSNALAGQTITRANSGAIHLNINFDGTQNNRDFVKPEEGDWKTNVGSLAGLMENGGDRANTFYRSGIGAQTERSDAVNENGVPLPGSSPSNLESLPSKAGEIGSQIVADTYDRLVQRIAQLRADPATAGQEIAINITGFSRGSAEAVAFANLLNERGIPGVYESGKTPVNSMVLYDPVSQTAGILNVKWPTNVRNSLVLVAEDENRIYFPAMPVGADAIVIGVSGAHSDVGGSFNPDGISAVTLKIAHEFLRAAGAPIADITPDLQPNWDNMRRHNSAIDTHGIQMMPTVGDPASNVGVNRYYEGSGLGGISVKDMLGRGLKVTPVYETVNGRLVLAGFSGSTTTTTTSAETEATTRTTDTTAFKRDGITIRGRHVDSVTTTSSGLVTDKLVVNYKADGVSIASTEVSERLPNYNLLTRVRDGQGELTRTVELQGFDDGTALVTTKYPSGKSEVVATDSGGGAVSRVITTPLNGGKEQVESFDGSGKLLSRSVVEYFYDENGTSRIETVTTANGTVKNTYNNDGTLFRSEPVNNNSGLSNLLTPVADGTNAVLSTAADVLSLGQLLSTGGNKTIKLASGALLLNNLAARNGVPLLNANVAQIAQGVVSVGNLFASFQGGDLAKVSGTAHAVNYVNRTFFSEALKDPTSFGFTLNSALNGSGLVEDAAGNIIKTDFNGLANGGTPGVLSFVGLAISIRNKDPVGIAQGLGALVYGPAFLTTPVGWFLTGVQILRTLFAGDPPDAWGQARVVYGPGITNYTLEVEATGESFGPNRVQAQLGNLKTSLEQGVAQSNTHITDPAQRLGLIAQRMPQLTWRASEFGVDGMGYTVTDIDALTGEQRYPTLRFDDDGKIFNIDPNAITSELRNMLAVSPESAAAGITPLDAYLINSAWQRKAIAPLWEVQTAKLQTNIGDPNAGLTEEERAAKAGLGSGGNAGSFMVVGLDLNRDGQVNTRTLAQSREVQNNPQSTDQQKEANAVIGFDWDGKGFLKPTDWIDKEDGFLMLDRDANGYVTTGNDLLSNPLIADAGKGLRILAAQDSNDCYVINSELNSGYGGWVAIWYSKLTRLAVNDADWRDVA